MKFGSAKKRKICVVTTGRSDFGLLRQLMRCIQGDATLRLQVIATGMHLERRLGSTVKEIEESGVKVDRRINLGLKTDSALDNTAAIGRGVALFADAIAELKPAIIVLLGDRFELFAPAIGALMLRVPIAHIHGGERSEGAIDESVRHAITKMASLHFASTEPYRRRIIQMGESPKRVFNFGAPGLDELFNEQWMTRSELEHQLQFNLTGPMALVTYHPETHENESSRDQIETVLNAIERSRVRAIFTMANADAGGAVINLRVQKLCRNNPDRFKWFANLGRRRYLNCMKNVSLMIGNSSSGLIEAPSFRLPVVNIGDRQRGRIRARNVINVSRNEEEILRGIKQALSPQFRASLRGMKNPYDRFRDGQASMRIKNVLQNVELSTELLKKKFNDLPGGSVRSFLSKTPCQNYQRFLKWS